MLVKNQNNKNKGQVLVLVALSLVAFFGFAALAIDVAYFYHTRHQLQGAADAAALAGAAMLDKTVFFTQADARKEAWKFACKNSAAGLKVFLVKADSYCDSPPSSGLNETLNDINGDIAVGYWDGSSFHTGIDPVENMYTAVQVRARRTGAIPEMPRVKTFFGGIFGLIPGLQPISSVSISNVTAVASRFEAPVLPIAVNEYWMQRDANRRPYSDCVHLYPSSFVRYSSVGPVSTACNDMNNVSIPAGSRISPAWGRTFGILGANADDNVTPAQDVNSYVYLDTRSRNFDGSGASWFDLRIPPIPAVTCFSCGNAFSNTTGLEKTTGDISQTKFDESSLKYMFEGFPKDYVLPTAVRERFRNTTSGNYPSTNLLYPIPSSSCPYATVPFYAGGGNPPLNQTSPDGKAFKDNFKPGRKVVTLVYDGTFKPSPSSPNSGILVGYALLEIDGYANNPKDLDSNHDGTISKDELSPTNGNTLYAHAISHIVQPDSPFGVCDPAFFEKIKDLRIQGAVVRLVK